MFSYFQNPLEIIYSINYIIPTVLVLDPFIIDPLRAQKIKDSLLSEKIIKRSQIHYSEEQAIHEFSCLYSDIFLNKLKDAHIVAEELKLPRLNEFDYMDVLEFYSTSCDGTSLAIKRAFEKNKMVANLSGGFHHASKSKMSRFCLLNDVFYGLRRNHHQLQEKQIFIIDTDYHQSDGNISFLDDFPNVTLLSMDFQHDPALNHDRLISFECDTSILINEYLTHLEELIPNSRFDLIIFIAGYDVYREDPLTRGPFLEEEILSRDRFIFERFKKQPIVFLPSGGYGKDSWKLTFNSLKAYVKEIY